MLLVAWRCGCSPLWPLHNKIPRAFAVRHPNEQTATAALPTATHCISALSSTVEINSLDIRDICMSCSLLTLTQTHTHTHTRANIRKNEFGTTMKKQHMYTQFPYVQVRGG